MPDTPTPKHPKPELKRPDRLIRCFRAGSVEALFPILKGWPADELQALLGEVDEYHDVLLERLTTAYHDLAMKPENFFNEGNAKALDNAHKVAQADLLGMFAEISSVAQYYLEQRVKGDGPNA